MRIHLEGAQAVLDLLEHSATSGVSGGGDASSPALLATRWAAPCSPSFGPVGYGSDGILQQVGGGLDLQMDSALPASGAGVKSAAVAAGAGALLPMVGEPAPMRDEPHRTPVECPHRILQQCVWWLDLLVSSPDVVPPPTLTNGDGAAAVATGVGTTALATAVMRDALRRTPARLSSGRTESSDSASGGSTCW